MVVRLLFLVVWILGRLAGVVVCVVLVGGCAHQVAGRGRLADGVVTVPAEPALIRENSKAGAEATARYWIELGHSSFVTGDNKQFLELSISGCSACENTAKNTADLYARGAHINADPPQIHKVSTELFNAGKDSVVAIDLTTSRLTIVEKSGALSLLGDAQRKIFEIDLRWKDSQWKVAEVADATD